MAENRPWNLENFIDTLVVELDKTRETLAVKAINKPLSYTVKDMNIDLNIFPTFDGDQVRFITAKPGETGASKVSMQLASITDQQVRATSKISEKKNNVNIDEIELDKETKKKLRKLGVTTVDDIERMDSKNVDIEKITNKKFDYTKFANLVRQNNRKNTPPRIRQLSLQRSLDKNILLVKGENLASDSMFEPVAVLNNQLAKVVHSDENEIQIEVTKLNTGTDLNELVLTLDPYSIIRMEIKNK